MIKALRMLSAVLIATAIGGCGVVYQAGTRINAARMSDDLKVGETMPEVHNKWGEPDIREYPSANTEVWSYAYKPNSDDALAAVLYTSSKEGDKGTFLDLKFIGGKLVSWAEVSHTMPPKQRGGFNAGLSAPSIAPPAGAHY